MGRGERDYDQRKEEGLNPLHPECYCTDEDNTHCPQHNPLYHDQRLARRKACCADPQVRGGKCENCGTWVEDKADLPQGDNEG